MYTAIPRPTRGRNVNGHSPGITAIRCSSLYATAPATPLPCRSPGTSTPFDLRRGAVLHHCIRDRWARHQQGILHRRLDVLYPRVTRSRPRSPARPDSPESRHSPAPQFTEPHPRKLLRLMRHPHHRQPRLRQKFPDQLRPISRPLDPILSVLFRKVPACAPRNDLCVRTTSVCRKSTPVASLFMLYGWPLGPVRFLRVYAWLDLFNPPVSVDSYRRRRPDHRKCYPSFYATLPGCHFPRRRRMQPRH